MLVALCSLGCSNRGNGQEKSIGSYWGFRDKSYLCGPKSDGWM